MLKEELSKKTVVELRNMAKGLEIAGRWDMTKPQLIEAIIASEKANPTTEEKDTEKIVEEATENWDDEEEIVNSTEVVKVTKEYTVNGEKRTIACVPPEIKERYIQEAPIGTIVAFELDGKVRSAKIENRNSKKKLLMLKNKPGIEFIVPYSAILWVRSGNKWPDAIYELLTGGGKYGRKSYTAKQNH